MNRYDNKKGDKTKMLETQFKSFGRCSVVRLPVSMTDLWRKTQFTDMQQETPKTLEGAQLAGLALLKFDDAKQAPRAKSKWNNMMLCVIPSLFHDKTNNVH